MKTIIKNSLLASLAALALTSCSENSWNNDLDGFTAGPNVSEVKTVSYTLTDFDYSRLASNRFAIAKATK